MSPAVCYYIMPLNLKCIWRGRERQSHQTTGSRSFFCGCWATGCAPTTWAPLLLMFTNDEQTLQVLRQTQSQQQHSRWHASTYTCARAFWIFLFISGPFFFFIWLFRIYFIWRVSSEKGTAQQGPPRLRLGPHWTVRMRTVYRYIYIHHNWNANRVNDSQNRIWGWWFLLWYLEFAKIFVIIHIELIKYERVQLTDACFIYLSIYFCWGWRCRIRTFPSPPFQGFLYQPLPLRDWSSFSQHLIYSQL